MFKYAVDALTADPSGAVLAATPLFPMVPAAALLGYGAARTTSSLCNELRNAVFAKVRPACIVPAVLLHVPTHYCRTCLELLLLADSFCSKVQWCTTCHKSWEPSADMGYG